MAESKSMGDSPDGLYARIPIADITISEAAGLVDDPSFWSDTRPLILFHFPQITLSSYWELSVGDHRDLYEFLLSRGLVDGVS